MCSSAPYCSLSEQVEEVEDGRTEKFWTDGQTESFRTGKKKIRTTIFGRNKFRRTNFGRKSFGRIDGRKQIGRVQKNRTEKI